MLRFYGNTGFTVIPALSRVHRIRCLGLSSLRRSPERVKPEVCKHGQRQPEQHPELLNVSAASGSLPEFRFGEIYHLHTDHDRWRSAEPPTRRRTRDTKIRGDGQIPAALDELRSRRSEGCWGRDVVFMR